jgi:cellulose biosynthesis protein BcsQ
MISIAVFNNKGGVGKTTLLCNLSAYVALRLKKTVLVIDADPQCNTTQSMFPDDTVESFYSGDSFTINSVMKPVSSGRGYAKTIQTTKAEAFGVALIPGDPRLALVEDLLASDWGGVVGGNARSLRTTLVFADLLQKCQQYDYVFFDMGPSLGAINRSVLIACDCFITPMSIDIFSLKAVENISISLKKWREFLEKGLNNADEELALSKWQLAFSGYVTQQYTAKRDALGKRQAVSAFDRILKQFPKVIERELITGLAQSKDGADYNLGTIPSLHSLIPLSQLSRKPIFELKARDGVVGAHFAKVSDYETTISGIAKKLLKNVGKLSDG